MEDLCAQLEQLRRERDELRELLDIAWGLGVATGNLWGKHMSWCLYRVGKGACRCKEAADTIRRDYLRLRDHFQPPEEE